MKRTQPSPEDLAAHWDLERDVVFLNHGSFGACPRAVLEHQSRLRARLEAQPVRFFVREYYGLLDDARRELAAFVGADPECLAFVNNATTGVNCVLRSLELRSGDELLASDQAYNACRNALDACAARWGARVRVARVPFPLRDRSEVLAALVREASARTRLLLVDHVTSPTGLVLPLAEILHEFQGRGVEVLVDGAHAPGMLPLDIGALAPTYYAGNCHKWLCAPKGAGFLYVDRARRDDVRPLVVSHGANAPTDRRSRFRNEFDWIGTQDPTAWLSVPEAIRYVGSLLPDGWPEVMRRNRELALEARRIVCAALEVPEPAPEDMLGALAALPLADGEANPSSPLYTDPLADRLWREHRIEVPISPWPAPPKRVLRLSAQLYNRREQYERLAQVLRAESATRTTRR